MDMVGRNAPDSIVAIGREWSSLGLVLDDIERQRPELGLTVSPDLWPEQQLFFRSDQYHFVRKEIPALFLFSGLHDDYHQPSDTVEKVDTDKVARVARLAFYTAYEVANRPEPPVAANAARSSEVQNSPAGATIRDGKFRSRYNAAAHRPSLFRQRPVLRRRSCMCPLTADGSLRLVWTPPGILCRVRPGE
jgi:hypothetical protein